MKTTLYRHFDKDKNLLYVGVSSDPFRRTREHLSRSSWREEIRFLELDHFDTREQALDAERQAIAEEKPKYNKTLRPKPSKIRLAKPQDKNEKRRFFDNTAPLSEDAQAFLELLRSAERDHEAFITDPEILGRWDLEKIGQAFQELRIHSPKVKPYPTQTEAKSFPTGRLRYLKVKLSQPSEALHACSSLRDENIWITKNLLGL